MVCNTASIIPLDICFQPYTTCPVSYKSEDVVNTQTNKEKYEADIPILLLYRLRNNAMCLSRFHAKTLKIKTKHKRILYPTCHQKPKHIINIFLTFLTPNTEPY